MERLTLKIDKSTEYDDSIHHKSCLPSGDELTVISKQQQNGLVCVGLLFNVQLPDGSIRTAQFTTTGKLLCFAAEAIKAGHPFGNFV